jgi:hypothetical protein
MKLSDHLLYRDIQELGEMATYYECECNRNSKLELVQSIHHQILNQAVYVDLLNKIEQPLIFFLQYILYQPSITFSIDELIAKGKYIGQLFNYDQSPRKWVTELLKRGWLFPVSSKYQVQLEIPLDLHTFLKRQMLQHLSSIYQMTPHQKVNGSIRDEGKSIFLDLHTFLAYLKDQAIPIPVTLDGVIHKRYQQILYHKFNISEEVLKDKEWRFGYGRRFPSYPSRFAFIYDFCFSKEWIMEGQEGIFLTKKGEEIVSSEHFLHEESHQEVLKYWIRLYKHPIPSLPFIYRFIVDLLSNQWLESNQLYAMIKPWLKSYYFDDVEVIFRDRIIQMLVHLGVVQMSFNNEEQLTYLRIKKIN